MSKYKVGDKFVFEIQEVLETETGRGTLYRTSFNTLVFDDYGLDHLTKLSDKDIERLQELKEEDKIKMGDEVTYFHSPGTYYGIVTKVKGMQCEVLWSNRASTIEYNDSLTKTGRNHKDKLEDLISELTKKGE